LAPPPPPFVDARHHGVDAYRLAFFHQHLGQRSGGGRRDLGIDFIGGDFEQRFVALHTLAGLLEPLGERAFDNAFAHLGHHYVGHVSVLSFGCEDGGLVQHLAIKNAAEVRGQRSGNFFQA
jgi:hypothetical protein